MRGAHRVPFYAPAFASTHCTYPQRDGEAELVRVAGYIPGWSLIYVSTGPVSINYVDATNHITD